MTAAHAIVVCANDDDAAATDNGFPTDVTGVNSPYARRRAILAALAPAASAQFRLLPVGEREPTLDLARLAHAPGLVDYLEKAWERWVELGDRRCADFFHEHTVGAPEAARTMNDGVPALVPANATFRDALQQPGSALHAQTCYYLVDRFTPIFHGLRDALLSDLAVVRAAASAVPFPLPAHEPDAPRPPLPPPVYALVTHPGHHATAQSVGGFCYLNSAAILARLLQARAQESRRAGGMVAEAPCRVAIVDVDYHFGNGTASIFYEDASVFVASLHADPETEYPFNSGFASQTGAGTAVGATLCAPLAPYTRWDVAGTGGGETYEEALRRAIAAVSSHGAEALVVSLGVDAYAADPVHLPAAGVKLRLDDFERMGAVLAEARLPTWLVQEGGYMLDIVGDAVRNVLCGLLRAQGHAT
ncbi:hypothetical protein KFE25_002709 [Diacronema lutheri]|uniref:Histone deacetylase domain-containing protein n=2 Tax=Diacronema lutheri TaxID=2081491 RepID=A0A8J5XJC5_DIALT|nr:hypothetical protein KFE25_002709 [Diacronema lutheri]